RTGLGVDRPAAPAAGVGDEDIDPTPGLDHAGDHSRNRVGVADIDFKTQRGAARCRDLGNGAVGGHVVRFRLEFLIRAKVEVGAGALRAETREPLRIGPSEAARRSGDEGHHAFELTHAARPRLRFRETLSYQRRPAWPQAKSSAGAAGLVLADSCGPGENKWWVHKDSNLGPAD